MRENILKISLRHRLQFAKGCDVRHESSGPASFRVRRLKVHGLSVSGKIWLFWNFLSRFIELWSKSWLSFPAASVICAQFLSQPMNCIFDFHRLWELLCSVGESKGLGGRRIQRQGGPWGHFTGNSKNETWTNWKILGMDSFVQGEKKVKITQSRFYLNPTFAFRVCSLLE